MYARVLLASLTCVFTPHSLLGPALRSQWTSAARMSTGDDIDWREMRARLIAQEQETGADGGGGYVYESPLIEQGTILLGGTKQDFGFALRQQFFHKCVLLLLQHDERFTKGIILNRPSALEIDGWRVWCGHGQVADGGMFVGADEAIGELEINALHSLDGFMVDTVSTRVIKGVSYTSLEGAKALVAAGVAKQSDFWVCVGYSGWAPGQLQMEVEKRDSWHMAAADGGTLLQELLRLARELPPPSSGEITPDHGVETWARLMRGIGREAELVPSEADYLADRMLGEWVRAHLLPKPPSAVPSSSNKAGEAQVVTVGTVLCSTVSSATGRPADRFLLRDQFLHKAVILVIGELAKGGVAACVLNRPTANEMRFNVPGSPSRRVAFCGDREFGGQLWLHHRAELGGVAVGSSGLFSLGGEEVVAKLQAEQAAASDFLLARRMTAFSRTELDAMLSAGELRILPSGVQLSSLWPRVWSLTDDGGDVSDGREVWWLASQCGSEQLTAPPPSELADAALGEWVKFFAMGTG